MTLDEVQNIVPNDIVEYKNPDGEEYTASRVLSNNGKEIIRQIIESNIESFPVGNTLSCPLISYVNNGFRLRTSPRTPRVPRTPRIQLLELGE